MEWTVPTVFSWVMLSVLLVIIWWYYSVATPPSLDHVNETGMKFLWPAVSHYPVVCAARLCDRSCLYIFICVYVTKNRSFGVFPIKTFPEKCSWIFLFALRHNECDTRLPVLGYSCSHLCASWGRGGPGCTHIFTDYGRCFVTPMTMLTWWANNDILCAAGVCGVASISLTVLSVHRVCVLWNSSSFRIHVLVNVWYSIHTCVESIANVRWCID